MNAAPRDEIIFARCDSRGDDVPSRRRTTFVLASIASPALVGEASARPYQSKVPR